MGQGETTLHNCAGGVSALESRVDGEEQEEAAKKLRGRKVGFNFRRECILGC